MNGDEALSSVNELPQGTLLINSAVDAVLTTIPDGRIISANPAACRMFGYSEKEIREGGRGLLVEQSDPRLPLLLERRRKSGRVVGQLTFLRKDGSRFEGEVSSSLFKGLEGQVFTSMIIRDLSQRYWLSDHLSTSEANFYQMFETMPVGITITDIDGKIIYSNPSAERILGVTSEAHRQRSIGGTDWKIIHADGSLILPEEYPSVIALREQRPVQNVEMGVFRGQDDLAWIMVNAAPFLQKGVLISYEDITERKKAEAEVRRLAAAVEQAGQAVLILNTQHQLLYANPSAFAFFDDTLAVGQEWTFLTGAREPQLVDQLWQALAEGHQWTGTFTFTRNESPLVLFFSAGPVRQEEHTGPAFVLTATDLTERTVWEERLINSQRLESIGTLAAGIAHDFNNLMAGVFGFIDIAGLLNQDENVGKYLSKAKQAIDRARKLTGQLLTFAKRQNTETSLSPLFPLVSETVELALSGSHVQVSYDVDEGLAACLIDTARISQVIENVVLNARQAMPQGGVLTLRAHNRVVDASEGDKVPPGRYVELEFYDQGVGIAPEHLPRIFDPFFTTKPQAQGLGLATSYSILTQHHGFIFVQSQQGQGTLVRIFLPAAEAIITPQEGL